MLMRMIEVRALTTGEWRLWRELRLAVTDGGQTLTTETVERFPGDFLRIPCMIVA